MHRLSYSIAVQCQHARKGHGALGQAHMHGVGMHVATKPAASSQQQLEEQSNGDCGAAAAPNGTPHGCSPQASAATREQGGRVRAHGHVGRHMTTSSCRQSQEEQRVMNPQHRCDHQALMDAACQCKARCACADQGRGACRMARCRGSIRWRSDLERMQLRLTLDGELQSMGQGFAVSHHGRQQGTRPLQSHPTAAHLCSACLLLLLGQQHLTQTGVWLACG